MRRFSTLLLMLILSASAFAQKGINYICLELDSVSHAIAADYAEKNLPWPDAQAIAHHMTILHHTGLRCAPDDPELAAKDYVLAWAKEHEGEDLLLTVTEVGHSDKAFALRVTDVAAPSRNRIKHITLATNRATGGKAVDSNYITHWETLEKPLTLKAKVVFFYTQQ